MYDGLSKSEMVNFPVHRIRFCARGHLNSTEKECFALSFTQKNATAGDPAIHQCHVFRCQIPEAVGFNYFHSFISFYFILFLSSFKDLFIFL